jgi:hypothetical protein
MADLGVLGYFPDDSGPSHRLTFPEYIHNAKTAEAIARQSPPVTLEQVYATILYYLQNKTAIGQYLSAWLDYTLTAEAQRDNDPDSGIQRLKALKASLAQHGEVRYLLVATQY